MTEQHECEWQSIVDWWRKSSWFRCRNCGAEIEMHEAELRLNEYETLKKATEALSVERARQLSDDLAEAQQTPSGVVMEIYHDDINAIKAYANILEGKDD